MSFLTSLSRVVNPSRRLISPVLTNAVRSFSAPAVTLPPDIEFAELKEKIEKKAVTLLDVRTPQELESVGMIPTSKHIMIYYVGPDILLSNEEFAEKYDFEKPALDEPIVVTCLLGIRARTAQLAMMAVGYSNVRVYKGSFQDWSEKEGPVVFPDKEE